MTERRCQGTNKRGEPCGAHPMRDRDYCNTHDPDVPESARFTGGAKPGAGRPRNPRAADVLRERIEAEIDEWYDVLIEARDAHRAVVVGSGDSAEVEMIPDYTVRLAAFKEALDRAFGKSRQALEHTGQDGGPITVTDLSWLKQP